MDLLVTPDRLARLRDQLTGCACQLAAVAERVDQLGREPGWQGEAQRAFAAQAREARRSLRRAGEAPPRRRAHGRALRRAARGGSLPVLRRLEHEVLGTLHRLAGRLVDDVTGHVRRVYDDVVRRLPSPGSPDWRPLATDLAAAVLP